MTTFTDIQAITFDIDDTLFDLSAVLEAAMSEAVQVLRERVAPGIADHIDVAHLAELREAVAEELAHARDTHGDWLVEVRRESFRRVVAQLDVDDHSELAEAITEAFFRRRHSGVVLYEGAATVLDELRTRYTIGIITNGNSSLAGTAVHDYFRCHVVASERGWSKPDVRIFDAACSELGVDASQVMHIGDSLPEDVAGAHAAGMRAVWFNPRGLVNDSQVVPDGEIAAYTQLTDMLARP